jgi:hypothetical protein
MLGKTAEITHDFEILEDCKPSPQRTQGYAKEKRKPQAHISPERFPSRTFASFAVKTQTQ